MPVSTSMGLHWPFPGSQVRNLCYLVGIALIKASKEPCCPVLLCSEQEQ